MTYFIFYNYPFCILYLYTYYIPVLAYLYWVGTLLYFYFYFCFFLVLYTGLFYIHVVGKKVSGDGMDGKRKEPNDWKIYSLFGFTRELIGGF